MKRYYQLFAILAMTLLLNAAAFSQYTQFGNLNNGSVNITSAWTRLNTTATSHTFTKAAAGTKIEVHVNSRFGIGALGGGATGVVFQVRVDNNMPNFENWGSILTSNTKEFLSIFAVFTGLPAGNHRVSIWARTGPVGNCTSVVVDPGGFGGKIIVKETS